MLKKIINIALAYVGVVIGAGLSSGQDLMQYFVSFGIWGIIGTLLLGVISVIFSKIIKITLINQYLSGGILRYKSLNTKEKVIKLVIINK